MLHFAKPLRQCSAAYEFLAGLPAFICHEFLSRCCHTLPDTEAGILLQEQLILEIMMSSDPGWVEMEFLADERC